MRREPTYPLPLRVSGFSYHHGVKFLGKAGLTKPPAVKRNRFFAPEWDLSLSSMGNDEENDLVLVPAKGMVCSMDREVMTCRKKPDMVDVVAW